MDLPRKVKDNAPPAYDQIDAPILEIPQLDLRQHAGPPQRTTITPDQCIVHLKFLAVLADLRDNIGSNDGLFGLHDAEADKISSTPNKACARIREKRWAVYTARAVERFSVWWQICIPRLGPLPTLRSLQEQSYNRVTMCEKRLLWSRDNMPPIDVIMVWHAYMLNPRAFLEDCIRHAKISFWATGFPWDVVNACIDNKSLEYTPGDPARKYFERTTGLQWDNLHDHPNHKVNCPNCAESTSVPWTAGEIHPCLERAFEKFYGFADKRFHATCQRCRFQIDHERLKVAKFRKDVKALLELGLPMPGSFYNSRGVPECPKNTIRHPSFFPSRFMMVLGRDLLGFTDTRLNRCRSMSDLRDELEKKIKDPRVRQQVNKGYNFKLLREDQVSFRRMMSHYWDNITPFALDLVGAVIRQGTFVQKMDNIDWLHSPALVPTMVRLINKYRIFFGIMVSHPEQMAVPTLDVDLAWHTHQLSPFRYFKFSLASSIHLKTFIDHDDKVDENKLSDGFEWTSKMYKKATNGEIYSECTCWYCEAIRAPDLYGGGFFASTTTSRARQAAASLHKRSDVSSDPDKNPHISAHSAVRSQRLAAAQDPRCLKAIQLRSNYEKARRRAEKRTRGKRSDGEKKLKDTAGDDIYTVPVVWGCPYFVPMYAPYMCDPCVHSDAYASNPVCIAFITRASGNCVGGTCGTTVAAGGCGGMIGGGCAGGCGGGGGGCGGGGGS